MNELIVVFYILATIAFAYLWLYPKVIGENVKQMVWADVFLTMIPLGISAILFWESDPTFKLFVFDLNWFLFTLFAMVLIEMPIFLLYLKARGLWKQYWALMSFAPSGSRDSGWASASVEQVQKQLNDTKWDGLRTLSAKRTLFWLSQVIILFGTGFLVAVGDNLWSAYSLIHILLIFVMWWLLRQSVRLVADAPEEALDEMHLARRNESYVLAFRYLAALMLALIIAFGTYVVFSDTADGSDGFNYTLSFTWPQAQALFWLVMGYMFISPSLAFIATELKDAKVSKGEQK